MKLKPLYDKIIVEAKKDTVSDVGLVMPDSANNSKPEQGEVVAVGTGRLNDKFEQVPMTVKIGDIVVFKKYSPDEIEVEKKKYLIISETDILAIVQ